MNANATVVGVVATYWATHIKYYIIEKKKKSLVNELISKVINLTFVLYSGSIYIASEIGASKVASNRLN